MSQITLNVYKEPTNSILIFVWRAMHVTKVYLFSLFFKRNSLVFHIEMIIFFEITMTLTRFLLFFLMKRSKTKHKIYECSMKKYISNKSLLNVEQIKILFNDFLQLFYDIA